MAKSASVTTNDPAFPQFSLVLRAFFKLEKPPASPSVVRPAPQPELPTAKPAGPFSVWPNDRWVSAALYGTSTRVTMYLRAAEEKPVHVKEVQAGGNDFYVDFQPIEDGKRYELNISTNPSLKPGDHTQTLKILTDDKARPEMTIPLEVKILPLVFVSPGSIMLPKMPTEGENNVGNLPSIHVRRLRERGLQIKSITSTLPFLKWNVITEKEGEVYKIDLSIDKSKIKTRGEFNGKLMIETNDPEVPHAEVSIKGTFE